MHYSFYWIAQIYKLTMNYLSFCKELIIYIFYATFNTCKSYTIQVKRAYSNQNQCKKQIESQVLFLRVLSQHLKPSNIHNNLVDDSRPSLKIQNHSREELERPPRRFKMHFKPSKIYKLFKLSKIKERVWRSKKQVWKDSKNSSSTWKLKNKFEGPKNKFKISSIWDQIFMPSLNIIQVQPSSPPKSS